MAIHLIRDLDALHRNVLTMCARVEELIDSAVDALHRRDYEKAEQIPAQDDEIDRMDVQIEEECLKLLALHQPVAVDLRRITTVMKISGELERVADLGVNISERALSIIRCGEVHVPDDFREMSHLALSMLHRSIDSYVEMDVRLARDVCQTDDRVDNLNREIIQDLILRMQRQPLLIELHMHLFSVCRQIERVADHATNIAEDVVYLVEGEIIRHRNRLQTGAA